MLGLFSIFNISLAAGEGVGGGKATGKQGKNQVGLQQ